MMHTESIHEETKKVLELLSASGVIDGFYLAGGTALAIQLGHRESIDLDWFCSAGFSNEQLISRLAKLGVFSLTSEDVDTVHGVLNGVKVSFLKYDHGQLFPFVEFDGVRVADERDIAAMKISAISSRGSKKDFIDLYFLMQKYHITELLVLFERKHSGIQYNMLHILKSLDFFDSADDDPMPIMLKPVEWPEVKRAIEREVDGYIAKYRK